MSYYLCHVPMLYTQTQSHKHLQDPLLTVNTLTFSSLLLYVQYPEQPVCTSLLFTLLFIKSQYTVFLFLYILLFFAHLVVFAHLFCTSYCLLHILLSLHILLFCTFLFIAHLLLFLLLLPYVCPCVMLLYIICILIILHCPLSGPDSITFHF